MKQQKNLQASLLEFYEIVKVDKQLASLYNRIADSFNAHKEETQELEQQNLQLQARITELVNATPGLDIAPGDERELGFAATETVLYEF